MAEVWQDLGMDEMEPTPVDHGLEILAGLTGAGASPSQVVEAVGQIVAGWADEAEMDAVTAQARIEQMWDSISRDAATLQEQIGDSAGADLESLAAANRMLAAMQAAVTALAKAHEHF